MGGLLPRAVSGLAKIEDQLALEAHTNEWQAALEEKHECDCVDDLLELDRKQRRECAPSLRAKNMRFFSERPALTDITVDQRRFRSLQESIGAFGPEQATLAWAAVDKCLYN